MVAPGHDGALLCLLSPTPCVLLWLLLLTLQLFFYTWHNPLSPASQVCSSCVIGFTSSLKYCLGPPLFAWRNLVSGTVSFHYYNLVSVILLYQACCVSFLRLLAGYCHFFAAPFVVCYPLLVFTILAVT